MGAAMARSVDGISPADECVPAVHKTVRLSCGEFQRSYAVRSQLYHEIKTAGMPPHTSLVLWGL